MDAPDPMRLTSPVVRPESAPTELCGIGTAVPEHRVSQETTASFLARTLPEASDRLIRRMAARSGIAHRHTVLADYGETDPSRFSFFGPDESLEPFPTTAARLRVYEREAVPLAAMAARRALDDARIEPHEVTHLVLTTCTGFFAPGPDQALVTELGLRPDTRRTLIGFMGCYAGFNGLRTADDIVRAHPEAVVLQVAVELCTLHLQKDPSIENLVSSLLFADGAAAAVYARRAGEGRVRVRHTATQLQPDTEDQMSWRIGDHGFVMRLSADVPRHLQSSLPSFVSRLHDEARVGDPGTYAVHPGGRRILEATADALGADASALGSSHDVLESHGNMSSATILFVLERALRTQPDVVTALGFGPGLTLEGAVLAR